MFWRKTIGTSVWLQSWMNCAAFSGVRVVGAAPQVAARRFDELDVGQAVEARLFERAVDLFAGDGGDRAARWRR